MKHITILILSLFIISCDDTVSLSTEDVPSIKYGTSFGKCVGHCITDVEVTAESLYAIKYSWDNSVSPISKIESFQKDKYQALLDMIDGSKFLALDPVIGCPDCADGGSEWLEVTLGTRTKKVTFENGKSIDGISEAVAELRRLKMQLLPIE
jgi:hypothetical protein